MEQKYVSCFVDVTLAVFVFILYLITCFFSNLQFNRFYLKIKGKRDILELSYIDQDLKKSYVGATTDPQIRPNPGLFYSIFA